VGEETKKKRKRKKSKKTARNAGRSGAAQPSHYARQQNQTEKQ
jgi:hypothetical protein